MKNLQRIAQALGLRLEKGGQGYVLYNKHHLQIHNEPTLARAAWYMALIIENREKKRA